VSEREREREREREKEREKERERWNIITLSFWNLIATSIYVCKKKLFTEHEKIILANATLT
jgi:hypothetical protein